MFHVLVFIFHKVIYRIRELDLTLGSYETSKGKMYSIFEDILT